MDKTIERAVGRAVVAMRDNLGDSLTVDDMARAAMFSKFHFVRIFQRTTGISPGRFLAALRLQQAKHLLVATSLRVSDISTQVGYTSVGTFSSRFSTLVGLSPTTFRRLGGHRPSIPSGPESGFLGAAEGVVRGTIRPPDTRPGLVFVGLFPDRMPAGRPVRCTVLDGPGPFRLDRVPDGEWYLLCQSVSTTSLEYAASHPFRGGDGLAVGTFGPIVVQGPTVHHVDLPLRPSSPLDLPLRPSSPLDPPVLLALLDVRKGALELARSA